MEWKRWFAAALTVFVIFAATAFAGWGFDPASWDSFERGMFAVLLIVLPPWVALCPLFD